jgi:hypothetical protein
MLRLRLSNLILGLAGLRMARAALTLLHTRWVRVNARRETILAGGKTAATSIPVPTGRSVLRAGNGELLARNDDQRKRAQSIPLTAADPELVPRAAPAFGVRYVDIDSSRREERDAGSFAELARSAASGAVLANAANRTAGFLAAGGRVLTSAGRGG